MKRAVIITPFDSYSYNVRIKYVETYLKERGYECLVISSDFDHRNKCRYAAERLNLELVHVLEYKKNLSLSRIYSHYVFAKNTYKRLEEIKPDLIYGSAPPNFIFRFVSKFKRKNKEVKLIYEIGDMWPETLPVSRKIKKLMSPVLVMWAGLRNRNLRYADAIVYECDLFRKKLQKYHLGIETRTIYLCKENFYKEKNFVRCDSNGLNIAYVGSINNIVDIDFILEILSKINESRRLTFHIIGAGESKSDLLLKCKKSNISYIDYGIVYDDEQKKSILEKCHLGLNIMKSSVMVGATMKSLEYFHWGLALINNIPGDTEKIVEEYKCGFNCIQNSNNTLLEVVDQITLLTDYQLNEMRDNSRMVYIKLFDEVAIKQKYEKLLDYVESL